MTNHFITLQDIRAYLDSLAPDQSCGIPGRPRACLVEKALEHKYPGEQFHVNSADARPLRGVDGTYPTDSADFSFSDEVRRVVSAFDQLAIEENPQNKTVTRQRAEDAIPELRGE